MTLIATFYSHFGAVRFARALKERGLPARMAPVPRDLSSSCGTCVRYEDPAPAPGGYGEEVEQVAEVLPAGYRILYRAEDG